MTTQEYWEFLRALEPVGNETQTPVTKIFQKAYDWFVIVGNCCSLLLVCWNVGQLWYNGTKIIWSLKQRAVHTGLGTFLRYFCCGIAAFKTNPKYSPVPETREDMERLQEQDVNSDDIGSIWIKLTQGDSVMEGPASLALSE